MRTEETFPHLFCIIPFTFYAFSYMLVYSKNVPKLNNQDSSIVIYELPIEKDKEVSIIHAKCLQVLFSKIVLSRSKSNTN